MTAPDARHVPTSGQLVVAVATYRRTEQLERLVPLLVQQLAAVDSPARVLVVDNDPLGDASSAVANLGLANVDYVHEPRPGIASARNAALEAASEDELLVFIDDDETPSAAWLAELVKGHRRFGAAAVAGPVVRSYAVEPKAWVREARVFDRYRRPTGTVVTAASTANLLLDLGFVRAHHLRFDDRLGLTGGSDHLFTRQITEAGGRIYWCDEAVVMDPVPASRLTSGWTLRRGYRSGNTSTVVDLMLADEAWQRGRLRGKSVAGGLARVSAGSVRALAGLVARRPEQQGRGAWTMARGAGMLGGALGHQYAEYRRPSGTRRGRSAALG